jgi:flagellin
MPISIMTNTTSLSAQRFLDGTQRALANNVSRLSSGQRINKAADDAAGLGISEKLKAEIRSTSQASRNANDGISMTQIAEGALSEVAGVLTRMRELATQSANGTLGSTERGFIQQEFTALRSEIDRISNVTEFNGRQLLSGSASGSGISLQIGIRNASNDRLTITINTVNSNSLAIGTASLSTQTNAQTALGAIDSAISTVSSRRASLGAVQNRLQSTISNLGVSFENLSAANSRIRDVDIAEETSSLTRNQILSQSGAAMLSQANQLPQVALSLLR